MFTFLKKFLNLFKSNKTSSTTANVYVMALPFCSLTVMDAFC